MILIHLISIVGSFAAGAVFLLIGCMAWRDDRLAAGTCFLVALLMAVSIVGHVGGIR